MQWQIINGSKLNARCWNDEFVVYNPLSGDTHILSRRASDMLLALQSSASDVLSLAQVLSGRWCCEIDAALLEEIEAALFDMQALSLVEPL
ncbi:HPr-rel-A system PqqD family peptide chaperone [Noviherbaspirillum sp.]|uniref:HPr-rel-A system PqqD family peptide chaperone n=1 Tax=Noviherbaspirillum sp. TaxID=1926288 RepID=UPI002FE0AE04